MRKEFRRRLDRIKYEWPIAITLFSEIFMAFVGIAFLVNPIHQTIKPASPWHQWGVPGLLVFGVAFTAVGLYGAFYRERLSGLIPTFLLVGIALPTAIHREDAIGIIFYVVCLAGGIAEAHNRRERMHLRGGAHLRGGGL